MMTGFLLVVFAGISFSARAGTDRIVRVKNSTRAYNYGSSCMEIALKKIKNNNEYSGGEEISVSGIDCKIEEVEHYGQNGIILKTIATVEKWTNRQQVEAVVKNNQSPEIIRWQEVKNFTNFE